MYTGVLRLTFNLKVLESKIISKFCLSTTTRFKRLQLKCAVSSRLTGLAATALVWYGTVSNVSQLTMQLDPCEQVSLLTRPIIQVRSGYKANYHQRYNTYKQLLPRHNGETQEKKKKKHFSPLSWCSSFHFTSLALVSCHWARGYLYWLYSIKMFFFSLWHCNEANPTLCQFHLVNSRLVNFILLCNSHFGQFHFVIQFPLFPISALSISFCQFPHLYFILSILSWQHGKLRIN